MNARQNEPENFPQVAAAFREAVAIALQELLQIEVIPAESGQESGPVIIATIELMREPPGRFSLVVSASTAARLAARYLPAGNAISAEMVDDVVGEFANVIAGQAKTMLKGTPYHFKLSTPAVLRIAPLMPKPATAIHISTDLGFLQLWIDMG